MPRQRPIRPDGQLGEAVAQLGGQLQIRPLRQHPQHRPPGGGGQIDPALPGAQPQPPRSPDDPFGDFPDPRGGGDPFAGSGAQQNGDGKNDGGDQG